MFFRTIVCSFREGKRGQRGQSYFYPFLDVVSGLSIQSFLSALTNLKYNKLALLSKEAFSCSFCPCSLPDPSSYTHPATVIIASSMSVETSMDLIRGQRDDLKRLCAEALSTLFQKEQPSPLGEAVAAV